MTQPPGKKRAAGVANSACGQKQTRYLSLLPTQGTNPSIVDQLGHSQADTENRRREKNGRQGGRKSQAKERETQSQAQQKFAQTGPQQVAAQSARAKQAQAQVQEVLNHEQKIDAKTAAAKAAVAGLSESELDRQLRE